MGVTGYNELSALGHRLRQAKDTELMRELRRGLQAGVKPLSQQIRTGSPQYTPAGYEVTFAKSLSFTTRINTTGTKAAVDFETVAKGRAERRRLRDINAGKLRHPVFGRYRYNRHGSRRRNAWVTQIVRPGLWTDPVRANYDNIRAEMRQVIRRVAEKITRG